MLRHSVYRHCKLMLTYRDELKHEVAQSLATRLKYSELEPGDRVISSVQIGEKWEVQEENTVKQFIYNYGDV